MIRNIEEQSLNAWPALGTMHFDGWVLRFAHGFTRRANSINPLYASTLDLTEKVSVCEGLYRAMRQDTVFKLTTAAQPSELDAFLDGQGYARAAATNVCCLELAGLEPMKQPGFESTNTASDTWLTSYCELNSVDFRHLATMRTLMANLVTLACFGTLKVEGRVVALGLAVRQPESAWLFDIVTAPLYRRQGFGREVVQHLLSWAYLDGARKAYLQVMQTNVAALALYEGLGFGKLYEYWYRVKANQSGMA